MITQNDIPVENTNVIKAEFYICSHTLPDETGKKYNLLLRSLSIMLAPQLFTSNSRRKYEPNISLKSHAINPISVYTMQKYFNGTINHKKISDFFDNSKLLKFFKTYNFDEKSKEGIFDYYKLAKNQNMLNEKYKDIKINPSFNIQIEVQINKKNLEQSLKVYNNTINNGIICE